MRQVVLCALILLTLAGCCSDQANPGPVGAAPDCAPPAAAAPMAAADEGCGAYPPEALPWQVWCCETETIQPPAAAPQKICVQGESCREIAIPAVYETYTEQVQTSSERTEWQRVECAPAAGQAECWRLVTIPAAFQTVEKQRLVTPASVRYERVPAIFEDVQSAPPPAITRKRWVRHPECEVSAPAAAAVEAPCAK